MREHPEQWKDMSRDRVEVAVFRRALDLFFREIYGEGIERVDVV